MIVTDFYCDKSDINCEPLVVCLGGFDSFHNGHCELLNLAKQLKRKDEKVAVTLFCGEGDVFKRKNGDVFSPEERLFLLEWLGVDVAVKVRFTAEFSCLSPEEFLNELFDNRLIARVICGEDFKFGKGGTAEVGFLKAFCEKRNVALNVLPFIKGADGKKLSTTDVKNALALGDVKKCRSDYGVRYFIRGKVIDGRKDGRKLGFPTANILPSNDKFPLKDGVYACTAEIDGKSYPAISNLGCAPTFGQSARLLECHMVGFDGDIYGKTLTVWFDDRIRDVKKFASIDELKNQLLDDISAVTNKKT